MFVENITVIRATLKNFSIELFTKDNKTFVFVSDEELEDGTYTLSITVVDEDGSSRMDNATYIIKIVKVCHMDGFIPIFIFAVVIIILHKKNTFKKQLKNLVVYSF